MGSLEIWGIEGLPEIRAGDDLATMLGSAEPRLRDGDVIIVSSKVVSKAEGRVRSGGREAAIAAETARVVARRAGTSIVQTRHGFVLAAAGVDGSNTEPGTVILLPEDPDASARRLRARLRRRLGVRVGVVVSDTFGRPWRNGVTDVAVGLAGLRGLDDLRGQPDSHGNVLDVTVTAAADEVAGAADLVKGKLTAVPAAVLRGLADRVHDADGPGVGPILRPAGEDMFPYGSRDVLTARPATPQFRRDEVEPAAVRRAIGAAATAPAPAGTTPWRLVLVESGHRRRRLLEAMDTPVPETGPRARDELGGAPCLIVPCLRAPRGNSYPDDRGPGTDREASLVALGAGLENLLVALAAEGLGSIWAPPTLFPSGVTARELALPPEWEPMGAVGVGHPSAPLGAGEPGDPDAVLLRR